MRAGGQIHIGREAREQIRRFEAHLRRELERSLLRDSGLGGGDLDLHVHDFLSDADYSIAQSDLISYLYFFQFIDPPGDPRRDRLTPNVAPRSSSPDSASSSSAPIPSPTRPRGRKPIRRRRSPD